MKDESGRWGVTFLGDYKNKDKNRDRDEDKSLTWFMWYDSIWYDSNSITEFIFSLLSVLF